MANPSCTSPGVSVELEPSLVELVLQLVELEDTQLLAAVEPIRSLVA